MAVLWNVCEIIVQKLHENIFSVAASYLTRYRNVFFWIGWPHRKMIQHIFTDCVIQFWCMSLWLCKDWKKNTQKLKNNSVKSWITKNLMEEFTLFSKQNSLSSVRSSRMFPILNCVKNFDWAASSKYTIVVYFSMYASASFSSIDNLENSVTHSSFPSLPVLASIDSISAGTLYSFSGTNFILPKFLLT